jgi:hypothetical protein
MSIRIGSLGGHRRRLIGAAVAVLVGGLALSWVAVSRAGSAGGPPIVKEVVNKEVFSTRALIALSVNVEGLASKWKAYKGTSATGPWTEVNGAAEPATEEIRIRIGTPDKELHSGPDKEAFFLRGLTPNTSYYARFEVETEAGKVEEVVPFKTLPVQKPEVDLLYNEDNVAPGETTTFESNGAPTDTAAGFAAKIDANGASATYHFEYAEQEAGPWSEFTSEATGTISEADEYRWLTPSLAGLKPETKYFVRLKAGNAKGEVTQAGFNTHSFAINCGSFRAPECNYLTTATAKPGTSGVSVRNVTGDSAYVSTHVAPHGSETQWRLEYAESESGPWSAVPGASGTISQAEAEAVDYGNSVPGTFGARLTGLKASTTYYVRAFAQNACKEGCGSTTGEVSSFTTSGAPSASVFLAHALHGESLRLLGGVNPNSAPTSAEQLVTLEGSPTGGSFTLSFDGQSTESLPYDASGENVGQALKALAANPEVYAEGPDGGPYTVFFLGRSGGVSQEPIVGDGKNLTPTGASVNVVSTLAGGVAYDARYRFQYVSEKAFADHGWSEPAEGKEEDAGSGTSEVYVGYDLPALTPGETYRYRLLAQSNAPGTGAVESGEQALTAPVPATVSGGEACPNEALRTGASAHLPDCRAYEQVTPVDKQGAQEPFHYGGLNLGAVAFAAEGSERLVFQTKGTEYLTGPGAGESPFYFTRAAGAWDMMGGTPQPEAGAEQYEPQVYSSDLSRVALQGAASTSVFGTALEEHYKTGPVGGPYNTVVSVPRKTVEEAEGIPGERAGWVAGDPSLSKLVFETRDHNLLGEPTGTKNGSDLYEYTQAGGLVQLNVTGERAVTIGSCGAAIAYGLEDGELVRVSQEASGEHSLSSDGSRVLFEAVPGSRCSEEPKHLYMRVDGAETVDLGPYRLLAANSEGTRLLLQSGVGSHEAVLYDLDSQVVTQLPGLAIGYPASEGLFAVAKDLSAAYYINGAGLYRYDIENERLEHVAPVYGPTNGHSPQMSVTANGRYAYFKGAVGGLPGGGLAGAGEAEAGKPTEQVFRYDAHERVVECVSCASAYDTEPRQPAFMYSFQAHPQINGALPLDMAVSTNGDYAVFTTPAALLPEDIDGEIGVEDESLNGGLKNGEYANGLTDTPSSDVYEWRRDGVHGCAQLQGCLALITGGHGGYRNIPLAVANEGRDIFFYTREKLVGQDNDTAGDIYDAREGGGFAPPPPPATECEQDACASAPAAPLDTTPASLTFGGQGNIVASPPGARAVKPKAKAKKGKRKRRGRKSGRLGRHGAHGKPRHRSRNGNRRVIK